MEALGPAGAWTLSSAEVGKVESALAPDSPATLLTRRSRIALRQPCTPAGRKPADRYGLGQLSFGDLWGHTGSVEGVRTVTLSLPNGYVVTILTATTSDTWVGPLLETFSKEFARAEALPPLVKQHDQCAVRFGHR